MSSDRGLGDGRPNRREALGWLGAGCGGFLLGGCQTRTDPRYLSLWIRHRGRRTRIRLEQRQRRSPLVPNDSLILRRYQGLGTTAAREAQLLYLAETARQEEAYLLSEPDGVWTEIGTHTEQGDNRWGGFGIRKLPVRALVELYAGSRRRRRSLPRPERLTNYHYHPRLLAGPALLKLGLPAKFAKMIQLPSAADLAAHARLERAFTPRGIKVRSKVAVPGALVTYTVEPTLAAEIASSRRPESILPLRVWEAARKNFAKWDVGYEDFRRDLDSRLSRHGFKRPPFGFSVEKRRLISPAD